MNIGELLQESEHTLVTIGPDASVMSAVQTLNEHNIGALPVCDASGALVGMFSERDIIRSISDAITHLDDVTVSDLMTADVATCTDKDGVEDVMKIMDSRRIRHMPVLSGGNLIAVLSSKDVLTHLLHKNKAIATHMTLAYEMVR